MTKMDQPKEIAFRNTDQPDTRALAAATGSSATSELDRQIQRVRRIGKRMFGVANCIVSLTGAPIVATTPAQGKRSMESIEIAFCDTIPLSEHATAVSDTRNDMMLSNHRSVVGAPYIRFYASHPIYSQNNLAGSISLVDYAARDFSEEDKLLLADLSALIERELHMGALNSSQLELQRKNRNLRRDSLVDPVIGTWNRAAITRVLTTETDRCKKEELPLSLVFVDMDSIRTIIDLHGHMIGDSVLLKAASRLRSCIRPSDALGRFDGEKFMIVLPGASHDIAKVVAERMRQAVMSEPETAGAVTVNLTISAGTVSTDRFESASIDQLIAQADAALRSAKSTGINRIVQALPNP